MKKKKKTERVKSRNPPKGFDGVEDGWESETDDSDSQDVDEGGESDTIAGQGSRLTLDDDNYEGTIS